MKKAMTFFKKRRYLIPCVFVLLSLPFLVGESTSSLEENFLRYEMDLAHWGLEDPSEVEYLSAGIIHKKSGDELVVYDVRRKKMDS